MDKSPPLSPVAQVLNRRKGPAVQGPRAQMDRGLFKSRLQEALARQDGMQVAEAAVEDLVLEAGNKVKEGVVGSGASFFFFFFFLGLEPNFSGSTTP